MKKNGHLSSIMMLSRKAINKMVGFCGATRAGEKLYSSLSKCRPIPLASVTESKKVLSCLSKRPVGGFPEGGFLYDATLELTVVVPAYNAQNYIDDCLLSVTRQEGVQSLEIIVVDDGSTDDTNNKLLAWCEKDSRIRLITQENRGHSGARNTGILNARGNYIAFIDSDDMLAQGHIQCLLNELRAHPEADYVSGCYSLMSVEGKVKRKGELCRTHGGPCGRIYRRCVWQTLRFPEGFWFEDTIQAMCIDPLYEGIVIDDFGYLYRQNSSSITHTYACNYKSIDAFYVVDELTHWWQKLSIPQNEKQRKTLLIQLGPVLIKRTALLDEFERRCLFCLCCELWNSLSWLSHCKQTGNQYLEDVALSLSERNYRLWKRGSIWSNQ